MASQLGVAGPSHVQPSAGGRLQATSTSPDRGAQLSSVSVAIHLKPHPQSTIRSFRVVFGKADAVTSVVYEQRSPEDEYIVLLATAPPLSSVGPYDPVDSRVKLSVQAADAAGEIVTQCDAGVFTYTQGAPQSPVTVEGPFDPLGAAQQPAFVPANSNFTDSAAFELPFHAQKLGSSPTNQYWQSAGVSATPNFVAAPRQQPRIFQPTITTESTAIEGPDKVRRPPLPMPAANGNRITRGSRLTADQQKRAYPIQLVFDADMSRMTKCWSEQEEWRHRRRLVRVHRVQQGHFIHIGCEAISADIYQRMDAVERDRLAVVSCIYRDDRDKCYVTASDVLYLLEAIIGVRLDAAERNRLRANIESNPAELVSKNRPEMSAVHHTVTEPARQPRAIDGDRDIRMFLWTSLAPVLQRILLKYTLVTAAGEPVVTALQTQPTLTFSPYATPLPSPHLAHTPSLVTAGSSNSLTTFFPSPSSVSAATSMQFSSFGMSAPQHLPMPTPPLHSPRPPSQAPPQQLQRQISPGALGTRLRMLQGRDAELAMDCIGQLTGGRPHNVNAIIVESLPDGVIRALYDLLASLSQPLRHQPSPRLQFQPHFPPLGSPGLAQSPHQAASASPATAQAGTAPSSTSKKKGKRPAKKRRSADDDDESDIPSDEVSDEDAGLDYVDDDDSDYAEGAASKKRKKSARGRGSRRHA